jgi:hypothetical protein
VVLASDGLASFTNLALEVSPGLTAELYFTSTTRDMEGKELRSPSLQIATSFLVSTQEDERITIALDDPNAPPEGDSNYTVEITQLPATADGLLFQTDGTTAISSVPTTVTDSQRRVVFTPARNRYGTPLARFAFRRLPNGQNVSVAVNVAPVNDAPIATSLSLTVKEGTETIITLQAVDVDNDTVSFIIDSLPNRGSVYQYDSSTSGRGSQIVSVPTYVTDSAGGRVIYEAPMNEGIGRIVTSFTYSADDGQLLSDVSALVNITIYGFNCYCSPGTYAKLDECLLCPVGSFSNTSGMSACILCATGSFAGQQGLSVCSQCAEGHYGKRQQRLFRPVGWLGLLMAAVGKGVWPGIRR